ncbi:hypothetical protein TYRP_020659 [Tyrophagus putrescentiae]|nr:hypothetical protein TYRP_020659 [Tyrophagus putrescentiae]
MKMINLKAGKVVVATVSHGNIIPLLLVVSALLLLTSSSVSRAQKTKSQAECTEPEEFWGCQSPTRGCQRLCENRRLKQVHTQCELSCEKACVCEAGFLRNGTTGGCIFPAECPPQLEEEEEALRKQNRVAAKKGNSIERDDRESL